MNTYDCMLDEFYGRRRKQNVDFRTQYIFGKICVPLHF